MLFGCCLLFPFWNDSRQDLNYQYSDTSDKKDPAAACLIFVTVAALDAEGCCWKLSELLHQWFGQWIYIFFRRWTQSKLHSLCGWMNLKTCLDVGHLFKNFQDALYVITRMFTAWKRGVGALLSVSTFKHERAPMSCLHALEANIWTNNNLQRNHQWLWSRVLIAHTTLWTGTMSLSAWFSLRCTPH